MATVIRFSAILGIFLVSLKMTLVWNDNKIHTPDDKAREALNRAIDESTRKRREGAEQHECVALVAEAFARATRVFLYTIRSLVTIARTGGPYGVASAIRDLLVSQGAGRVWAKREGSLRGQFVHSAPGEPQGLGRFTNTHNAARFFVAT